MLVIMRPGIWTLVNTENSLTLLGGWHDMCIRTINGVAGRVAWAGWMKPEESGGKGAGTRPLSDVSLGLTVEQAPYTVQSR